MNSSAHDDFSTLCMHIDNQFHLTYCSNSHPANTWSEVFHNLEDYLPAVKKKLNCSRPFGVGLYLSNLASQQILESSNLNDFKRWLDDNGFYVFTMNGFPYGNFHQDVVKDDVYRPDWTTRERVLYTKRLFHILSFLLPADLSGGVSTSPITYKYWLRRDDNFEHINTQSVTHLAEIAMLLHQMRNQTGKLLHLDIEPEPDCLLENSDEVINFFHHWLLPAGSETIASELRIDTDSAAHIILEHIRVCYDICHFAVEYEEPETVINKLASANIGIGKIQISAALKLRFFNNNRTGFSEIQRLQEPKYLHQVVIKDASGTLSHYRDLPDAIMSDKFQNCEWRTHFHVPVFMKDYGCLQSTQDDILKLISIIKERQVTSHLEVETYTWDVLPSEHKTELADSISRELAWTMRHLHE